MLIFLNIKKKIVRAKFRDFKFLYLNFSFKIALNIYYGMHFSCFLINIFLYFLNNVLTKYLMPFVKICISLRYF